MANDAFGVRLAALQVLLQGRRASTVIAYSSTMSKNRSDLAGIDESKFG